MASELDKPDSKKIKVAYCIECECVEFSKDRLTEMLTAVCKRFGAVGTRINLAVVGSEAISKIGAEFLDDPNVTDVISFDLSDDCGEQIFDIVVNAQLALEKTAKKGLSPEAELSLYALHGVMHNLGFDDIEPGDAKEMHLKEDEILQQFGYGRVYAVE